MKKVLNYYKDDSLKYAAAVFLIENMPAHVSYKGGDINKYYEIAHELLKSDLSHVQIRDSLLYVRKHLYPYLEKELISDVKIMKSDYLIYTIDHAFDKWKNSTWTYTYRFCYIFSTLAFL